MTSIYRRMRRKICFAQIENKKAPAGACNKILYPADVRLGYYGPYQDVRLDVITEVAFARVFSDMYYICFLAVLKGRCLRHLKKYLRWLSSEGSLLCIIHHNTPVIPLY